MVAASAYGSMAVVGVLVAACCFACSLCFSSLIGLPTSVFLLVVVLAIPYLVFRLLSILGFDFV